MGNCKNVGSVDRIARAVVGIVALVLAIVFLNVMGGAVWGIVVAIMGAIMLGTAAIGVCPLYVPLGISTCRAGTK